MGNKRRRTGVPDLEGLAYEPTIGIPDLRNLYFGDLEGLIDPALFSGPQTESFTQGGVQHARLAEGTPQDEKIPKVKQEPNLDTSDQEGLSDDSMSDVGDLADLFGEPYPEIVARVKAWCSYSKLLSDIASGQPTADIPNKPEPHRGHFHSLPEIHTWFERRFLRAKRDILGYWQHPKRCSGQVGGKYCGMPSSDGKQVNTCWNCMLGYEILKDALHDWIKLCVREKDIFTGAQKDAFQCLQDIRDVYALRITALHSEIDELEKFSMVESAINRCNQTTELAMQLQRLLACQDREIEVGRAKGWTSQWTRCEWLDVKFKLPEGYRCCLY